MQNACVEVPERNVEWIKGFHVWGTFSNLNGFLTGVLFPNCLLYTSDAADE